MEQHICKNCGNHFKGKFCNNCGEKVYTEHDKSMRHFLDEVFHFFTHLDSKFFKTLLLMFRKPGMLSLEYSNGSRKKYYNPFSLFFVGIILYLLFPLFPGLNLPFGTNMVNFKNSGLNFFATLAEHKAIAKHISIQALEEKYDHRSPAFAKALLLIILPLTGIVLKMLFSKKRKYFFDYLVLSTEFSCITLYLVFFVLPLLLLITGKLVALVLGPTIIGDLIILPLYMLFMVFWTIKALRRFFQISFTPALLKGILFLFLQSVVIFIIYRIILFLTVLLFI